MPQARDDVVNFMTWELATLTRLSALCHFDLQLFSIYQIMSSHAEASRGDLLDGAAPPVAVRILVIALFVFAAFAGVRLTADPVHGDGQRLVRFLADGAERHRSSCKALDDFFRRFDLI